MEQDSCGNSNSQWALRYCPTLNMVSCTISADKMLWWCFDWWIQFPFFIHTEYCGSIVSVSLTLNKFCEFTLNKLTFINSMLQFYKNFFYNNSLAPMWPNSMPFLGPAQKVCNLLPQHTDKLLPLQLNAPQAHSCKPIDLPTMWGLGNFLLAPLCSLVLSTAPRGLLSEFRSVNAWYELWPLFLQFMTACKLWIS